MANRVFNIQVPIEMDGATRLQLANDVINKIKSNVSKGIDKNGSPFKGVKSSNTYSDSYVNSVDFRAAGKSKRPINLRLSGDMMDSLDIVEHGVGYIDIGYEAGTEENEKADWAIEGSKTRPARDFLGVSDIENLITQYETTPLEDLVQSTIDQEITDENLDSILENLIG